MESAFWRYLGLLGLLWLAMMAAGVAFAISKGRHIAHALSSVEEHAAALADARRLERLPASRIEEVARALGALAKASARLQEAMHERDRSLEFEQKARGAAEAASRAKDEFLAMLGHELRNPLAAIASSVTILRAETRNAQQIEFAAGVVERQSRHLKRLIDDLLDVGRVMTGKVVLERAPFELAAAVRQVAAALGAAGRFAQRRVALDATPVWVDGDQTRVEQIVSNLVVNAVKFTAASGSIQIRVAPENGAALIEVSDDGRGIARENLERVFELFYQDEAGGDRSGGGLGIGLTVVRRLAELHGGSVAVRSEGKGRGASFTVRLPAMAAAPAAEPELPVQDAGLAHAILLVEDNEDERESLRVALELKGQSVLHAADGHMALELLRRFRPPAAILDIGLPGMNGYELARAARAALGQDILLVALTGYGSEADRLRALAAGFDHHFTKPVEIAELMQVLALARARADARSNQSGLSADQKIA
jgi:signal transduction histidine kinase/ActR/RegA family two-component response regulator